MTKPWLILGIIPEMGVVILAECDSLVTANDFIRSGILIKRFKKSVISWVESREEYNNKTKDGHGYLF